MIADAVAQQPDAAYLLVQRTMILEQALDAAKAQTSDLQRQLQVLQSQDNNKSFLDANSWGNASRVTEKSVTGAEIPANMPKQNAAPPADAARSASPGFLGGGTGGMMGTIAATAAGVAGGAFLFQGIGNLLGNQHNQGASEKLARKEAEPAPPAEGDTSPRNPDTALNDAQAADNATSDDLFAGDNGSDDGSYES